MIDRETAADDAWLGRIAKLWLVSDLRARLVVDAHLNVHWTNAEARRLIGKSAVVDIRNGQLNVADEIGLPGLKRLCFTMGEATRSASVVIRDADEFLIVTAFRDPQANLFFLELRSTAAKAHIADFAPHFGLTESESSVVEALAYGMTASEISQMRGVSLNTIRTQIRKSYAKLGVRSREAFLNRIRSFML